MMSMRFQIMANIVTGINTTIDTMTNKLPSSPFYISFSIASSSPLKASSIVAMI